MKTCCVYCHTNTNNNKCYVGWTSTTMEKRWARHCSSSRAGSKSHFHSAIRKWGTECWIHETLEGLLTAEEAKTAEILWIQNKRSHVFTYKEFGYNETTGGEGCYGCKRSPEYRARASVIARNRSPEVRYKTGNANRGKKLSNKHREKISAGMRGNKHSAETKEKIRSSNQGQKRTLETRENIRLAKLGKPMSKAAREKAGKHCQKPVLQYSLRGEFLNEFSSIVLAATTVGVAATNISRSCKDKNRTSAGFKWAYKEPTQ